jgi:septal ring factor EnvC (AmiA/AmiB activator)
MVLGLLCSYSVYAQDKRTELEGNKKRIEEEIAYTMRLIDETKQSRELTLNELKMLNTKIRQREALVANVQSQLQQLGSQISRRESEKARLEKELKQLRGEYAKMIYFAYKNRNAYNKLMFLFSSADFNQAYQRLKYFQQYTVFRQQQILKIEETQHRLQDEIEKLDSDRADKQTLLETEKQQQTVLSNERNQVDRTAQQLSQKEKQLRQQLRDKEREAQQLQRAIESIIAEELRLARERAGEAPVKDDRLMRLTPEEQALSKSFEENKGKLPWPVERGVISSRFGEQPHPVLKRVTIKNNGIDISTTSGSEARAVFEGTVVSTNRITQSNNAVIIRHGDYFTVYSNLDQVYVKRGDVVKTKEAVGRIHTDRIESKTEVHFELWNNRQIIDPAPWLAR